MAIKMIVTYLDGTFYHKDLTYDKERFNRLYSKMKEPIGEGDIIVFGNVGGYSIVSKPPFIQPNCSVFAWNRNNRIVEIKRSEKFDDIFRTFLI